jgi:Uma2 family endonuclease
MATQPTTGLTYQDLRAFPDDNLRRELIDGELLVTPSPSRRHQQTVLKLAGAPLAVQELHGGEVYPAPMDVLLSNANVIEPDLLFLRPGNLETVDPDKIQKVPDLVIEVSSPSTRRTDLTRKKELYERFGVSEYWFVDLQEEHVEVYRLRRGRFGVPEILRNGDVLTSPVLPGFSFDLSAILKRAIPAV